MSDHKAPEPAVTEATGHVTRLIHGRSRDLGGFGVRRVLPAREHRMIGPFIFLDEMGPAELAPGEGLNVRPHPHIGLATITYLLEGEILHRDSLGFSQPIRPGAVNLMSAGRGIVHSERPGSDLHQRSRLHGLQTWIALPTEAETGAPSFAHYPADTIPMTRRDGAQIRVIIGEAFGLRSPVQCPAPALYVECRLEAGARLVCPEAPELGLYVVHGQVDAGGQPCPPGTLAVLQPGRGITVQARDASLIMLLGGEPVGSRHIWWNFVASDPSQIEHAKQAWTERRFPDIPGDDQEWVPLPAI
ncbi:pirin family protein [Abyssibacter sp.]|jgi:hypothetical protein|uniref:pirin family protein n=1 Tax=Abyssibacter sp. TaxID=2320200 RepID=UPI0025BE0838|nr:pirin family protein [Abyssibacter sp.]MCK5859656.1 pirin family protein [Abyssibacter sp.]